MYKFLIINPGSTSTKIAFYENDTEKESNTIVHPAEVTDGFDKIYDQFDFRLELIKQVVYDFGEDLSQYSAIIGRGGNMRPVVGGTYKVNEEMLADLQGGYLGEHASNLGGCLAHAIASGFGLDAYVVDPVVVDEFEPSAYISGTPLISRKSKDHPLNCKATARIAAKDLGGDYNKMSFIVAHMGGGISVGAHKNGRVIDINNCLNGDGPMSPERSGGLPFGSVIELCFSGKYTKSELEKKLVGGGGLNGYLGTKDARGVVKRIEAGDEYAESIYKAMAYQIAKDIGACATVLCGRVDAIVFTGGLAYEDMLMGLIKERVEFIAPILRYPGENEMTALAQGVMRVLDGEERAQVYPNI